MRKGQAGLMCMMAFKRLNSLSAGLKRKQNQVVETRFGIRKGSHYLYSDSPKVQKRKMKSIRRRKRK